MRAAWSTLATVYSQEHMPGSATTAPVAGTQRRLSQLRTQLHHQLLGPAACTPPATPCTAATSPAHPQLLSDSDLAAFVKTGFLQLQLTEIPDSAHIRLNADAEGLWRRSGAAFGAGLGNNITRALPGLIDDVARSPSVGAALERILGPGFALYAHRFMHIRRWTPVLAP